MSLPTAAPQAMAALGAVAPQISPLEGMILGLNSNPYFIGTMMLLLNLGGRFIAMEMTKSQEQFFQQPWVRRLLLFTVLFVGTRNVVVAFWMSLIIILLIGYLFNENSSLCLFNLGTEGSSCRTSSIQQPVPTTPIPGPSAAGAGLVGLTPEESEIYKRLSDKYARTAAQVQSVEDTAKSVKAKKASDVYWQNMTAMRQVEGFVGIQRF